MVLRLAEQSSKTNPQSRASEYFAKLVNEESDGKISIKVYCDGSLGNTEQVIEQLRFGGIALGRIGFAELSEAVPAIKPFTESVITQTSTCHDKIVQNLDFISNSFQAEKLYPLSVFYPDTRCFYTDSPKYFFSSAMIFRGVKIGTVSSSIVHDILKKYGAIPVDVISADTYHSMQKSYLNVVDSDLCDFLMGSDYRFARYVMLSDYISNPKVLVISNEVWSHLSIEQQKIMRECAERTVAYQQALMTRFYTANLPEVKKQKSLLYLD